MHPVGWKTLLQQGSGASFAFGFDTVVIPSEWLQHPVQTRNGVHRWARAKAHHAVERGPPRLRGGRKKRYRLGQAERRAGSGGKKP